MAFIYRSIYRSGWIHSPDHRRGSESLRGEADYFIINYYSLALSYHSLKDYFRQVILYRFGLNADLNWFQTFNLIREIQSRQAPEGFGGKRLTHIVRQFLDFYMFRKLSLLLCRLRFRGICAKK